MCRHRCRCAAPARDTLDRKIAGLKAIVHENHLAGMGVDAIGNLLARAVDGGGTRP
jgi:hypothetical protein